MTCPYEPVVGCTSPYHDEVDCATARMATENWCKTCLESEDKPATMVDMTAYTPSPGDIVRLYHGEMEGVGMVIAVTHLGVHVEVCGPRARMVIMPPSMVGPR